MGKYLVIACFYFFSSFVSAQEHAQSQGKIKKLNGQFVFKNATIISWDAAGMGAALFLKDSLVNEKILVKPDFNSADILLLTDTKRGLGKRGYILEILANQIIITAGNETGLKNGIHKLLFLCFGDDKAMDRKLSAVRLECMELTYTE